MTQDAHDRSQIMPIDVCLKAKDVTNRNFLEDEERIVSNKLFDHIRLYGFLKSTDVSRSAGSSMKNF